MKFWYGYTETYSETMTKAVGATTRIQRDTLPVGSPTDLNSIWLAKNGSDANPGTQASPKLTLNGAIAALGGGKTNVQIFRNSYVGDLTFNETTLSTLPAGNTIQVELGELATINFTVGTDKLNVSSGAIINGIKFTSAKRTDTTGLIVVLSGSVELRNCTIETYGGRCITYNGVTTSAVVIGRYSAFFGDNADYMFYLPSNGSTDFTNCIFAGSTSSYAILWSAGPLAAAQVISFTRCVFFNARYVIFAQDYTQTSLANAHTYDFNGCTFISCQYVIYAQDNPGAGITAYYKIDLDYCYAAVLGSLSYLANISPGNSFVGETVTNALDSTKPTLFFDLDAGVTSRNPEAFRLQVIGRTTYSGIGRYYLTSPLKLAYSGVDAAPWDESTGNLIRSFTQSITLTETIIKPMIPSSATITHKMSNYAETIDLSGNIHVRNDGRRRVFQLDFPAGERYANVNDIRRLIHMCRDTKPIKFYPRDDGAVTGHLMRDPATDAIDSTACVVSDLSPVDSKRKLVTITDLPSSVPLIRGNWEGFWILISARECYIESVTEPNILTVYDKLGSGLPSNGNKVYTINYIVVRAMVQELALSQENYTKFKKGQSFREGRDDTSYPFEWHGFSLILHEIEEVNAF